MRASWLFRVGKWTVTSSFNILRTPYLHADGPSSRVASGGHVLFLEYDGCKEDVGLFEVDCLIELYKLSHFYEWRSDPNKENWHFINLDIRSFREQWETIRRTSCDYAFKQAPFNDMFRSFVLRASPKGTRKPKPQFIRRIDSPYSEYSQSSFHAMLIQKLYQVPIALTRPDGFSTGFMRDYETAKL